MRNLHFFGRRRAERELDDEIELHLGLLTDRFVRQGMTLDEARHAARRQFGNRTLLCETRMEMSGWTWIETIGQDIRYGLRSLKRNPGFATVAVITLALGVGANTAIFGVVKTVLLDPLPYADAGRLVTIEEPWPKMPERPTVRYGAIERFRDHSRSLENAGGYLDQGRRLLENGEAEIVRGLSVTRGFFETLGVYPQLGRTFLTEEYRPGQSPNVVILNHNLWVRRFGADPRIVGTLLRFSSGDCRVIGVLPANFEPLLHGTSELLPEIYVPLVPGRNWGVWSVARLKRGMSLERAQAEIDSLMAGIIRDFPRDHEDGARAVIKPLRKRLFGRTETALWCIWGAVAFVLLIACVNVANMVLARATGRAKELALRTALGASRARLIRQMLIESLLLSGAGAAAGLILAYAGTGALGWLVPRQIPRAGQAHVGGVVLMFGLVVALLTGILFGVAPAWHMSRVDPNHAMKRPGTRGGSRHQNRLRAGLLVAEVALAFVLVLGAGLMAKSFIRLTSVDPGYHPHNVLTATTGLSTDRLENPAAGLQYYRETLDRVRSIPGIEGAALTTLLLMDYTDHGAVEVQDHPGDAPLAAEYSVSPDYFRVLRIPVKRGRVFTDQDTPATQAVAVVNESFARARFPHEDPIGKKIKPKWGPWLTVVGVVGDVRQSGLDQPPDEAIYGAQTQALWTSYYRLVARTRVDPVLLEREVRDAFRAVDKCEPVYHVKPLEQYLAGTLADRTFATGMLALFGVLALVLAAVGIYGVSSYSVSLRTREIGIRMALGARRSQVLTAVLRDVLALVIGGIAIGYVASVVVVRLLTKLLFEVRPTDIVTAAAVAGVLASIAVIAVGFPANRAASIDPTIALRDE